MMRSGRGGSESRPRPGFYMRLPAAALRYRHTGIRRDDPPAGERRARRPVLSPNALMEGGTVENETA
jgi:hypothetical protein